MATAKDIIVRVISSNVANDFVRKHHYSGKVVPNSQLHFGAFLDGVLHGVMSYGPSINKKGTINLVANTGWNQFLELNRMAFDDVLPKNSESRCIAISIKMIKKQASHIKWIVSFADGTQCGDGAIYRASGFLLTQIKANTSLWVNTKTKQQMQDMQFYHKMIKKTDEWRKIPGFMLRYVYLIDKTRELNTPVLPYSAIDDAKAGMYRGAKMTVASRKHAPEVLVATQ